MKAFNEFINRSPQDVDPQDVGEQDVDPQLVDAYYKIALAYDALNEKDRSRAVCDIVLDLNSQHGDAKVLKSRLRRERRRAVVGTLKTVIETKFCLQVMRPHR